MLNVVVVLMNCAIVWNAQCYWCCSLVANSCGSSHLLHYLTYFIVCTLGITVRNLKFHFNTLHSHTYDFLFEQVLIMILYFTQYVHYTVADDLNESLASEAANITKMTTGHGYSTNHIWCYHFSMYHRINQLQQFNCSNFTSQ